MSCCIRFFRAGARPRFQTLLCACGLLLLLPALSGAVELRPLSSFYNLSPQKQLYGLTALEGGELVAEGNWRLATTAALANTYSSRNVAIGAQGEQLLLDGETTRVSMALRYGVFSRLEIGAEIPLVGHSGGFLDSFIEGFHSLFGFPKGSRVDDARNKLEFYYHDGQQERFNLQDAAFGLGDIRLSAAYALLQASGPRDRDLALRLELKLPTGESADWRGSGATDVSARLALTQRGIIGEHPLNLFLTAGAVYLGEGELLPEKQNSLVGVGHAGLAFGMTESLAFNLQFDAHTPLFHDSVMREFEKAGLQIDIGGRYQINSHTSLDIGVGEDIFVHTAPDVTFHLALNLTL